MAGPTGVNARTSDGVFPSLGSIQSASYLKAGSVVKNYQDKLDYFIGETDEGSNIPISGTTPQLYANPEVTTPGTGETNTASNIGVGDGSFAQKVASDLQFNSEKYSYGIESQLLDNTYYRGLNPFIADQIHAFGGDMESLRSTPATVLNKSGVLEEVLADRPAHGKNGLDCYKQLTYKLLNSEALDSFQKVGSTINEAVFNSAGLSFCEMVESATTNVHEYRALIDVTSGVYESFSIHAKKSDRDFIAIKWDTGTVGTTVFDIENGTIISDDGFSSSIELMSDNIYKLTVTRLPTATLANGICRIQMRETAATESYTGDGISKTYLTGHGSVETGSSYPYQKTTTTQEVVAEGFYSIPVLGNLPPAGDDFTIVLKCKLTNDGWKHGAFSLEGVQYTLWRDAIGAINFRFTDKLGLIKQASLPNSDDVARYTVRFKNNEIQGFTNGVPGVAVACGGASYSSSSDILIGRTSLFGANAAQLNESVFIERIIIGALTDAQILELGGPDNVIL